MMGVFLGGASDQSDQSDLSDLSDSSDLSDLSDLLGLSGLPGLSDWLGGGLWLGALLAFFEGGFILGGRGKRRRTGRRSV